MTFERTRDFSLARLFLIFNYWAISDDGSPDVEHFLVNQDPRIWYVVAREGEELFGMLMFLPLSSVGWEMHFCAFPNVRGRGAEMLRAGFRWFFSQAPACFRICGSIPAYNRLAIAAALRAGAKQYGLNPRSFLKGGVLVDQILLGVSPGDV